MRTPGASSTQNGVTAGRDRHLPPELKKSLREALDSKDPYSLFKWYDLHYRDPRMNELILYALRYLIQTG